MNEWARHQRVPKTHLEAVRKVEANFDSRPFLVRTPQGHTLAFVSRSRAEAFAAKYNTTVEEKAS